MATPPTFTAGAVLTAAQMNGIGLWLVKSQTIGSAVASVTVTDAFSADYDNYVVTVTGGSQSAAGFMALTLGATVTGYYSGGVVTGASWTATLTAEAVVNAASLNAVRGNTNTLDGRFEIYNPNLAKVTTFRVNYVRADTSGLTNQYLGFLNNSTQYTDFTLTCSTGTVTGGQIRVYGYRN